MSALSRIPLPFKRSDITVREHGEHFPTVPNGAPGVVLWQEGRVTVQCAACWRTATAHKPFTVVVANNWDFQSDSGEPGWTKYRRCPDCRAARRHPAEQLDLLAHLEAAP